MPSTCLPGMLKDAPRLEKSCCAEARETEVKPHRVRTAEGTTFSGTWDEIVGGMRDHTDPTLPISVFMRAR